MWIDLTDVNGGKTMIVNSENVMCCSVTENKDKKKDAKKFLANIMLVGNTVISIHKDTKEDALAVLKDRLDIA